MKRAVFHVVLITVCVCIVWYGGAGRDMGHGGYGRHVNTPFAVWPIGFVAFSVWMITRPRRTLDDFPVFLWLFLAMNVMFVLLYKLLLDRLAVSERETAFHACLERPRGSCNPYGLMTDLPPPPELWPAALAAYALTIVGTHILLYRAYMNAGERGLSA